MIRRLSLAALCAIAATALAAPGASAEVKTLKYKFGPIDIAPGQNTIEVKPKSKQRGLYRGKRRGWKKAIVTLHPEDSIELFEGQEIGE